MTDDPISRIEAALEDHVLYLFTDSGGYAFSAVAIRALLDRLRAAEAENERLRSAVSWISSRCQHALENTDAR